LVKTDGGSRANAVCHIQRILNGMKGVYFEYLFGVVEDHELQLVGVASPKSPTLQSPCASNLTDTSKQCD